MELNLEIISPTGIVFKGDCALAVIPSVEGDIGVMYGHEALIAALRPGRILVYDNKETLLQSFDVESGFAEMHGLEKLIVLVDK